VVDDALRRHQELDHYDDLGLSLPQSVDPVSPQPFKAESGRFVRPPHWCDQNEWSSIDLNKSGITSALYGDECQVTIGVIKRGHEKLEQVTNSVIVECTPVEPEMDRTDEILQSIDSVKDLISPCPDPCVDRTGEVLDALERLDLSITTPDHTEVLKQLGELKLILEQLEIGGDLGFTVDLSAVLSAIASLSRDVANLKLVTESSRPECCDRTFEMLILLNSKTRRLL